MASLYSRRRTIAIFAAAAGLPLLTVKREAAARATTWTGQALGAPATLILNHDDQVNAERLVARVVAEVSRLEAVFSLYSADSALSELNRVGALAAPPPDLVSLLDSCRSFWKETDGAFDPTLQPLWVLYRDHFASPHADPRGPEPSDVRAAMGGIGFDAVKFNRDRIAMTNKGMALTLNGVAQGYITDRIVDLLRDAGLTSSLVDMGEIRAIGSRADGMAWRVGLADRQAEEYPDSTLSVVNRAVATSSAAGFHFDEAQRFSHILDPRTGEAASLYKRLTVIADDATTADALSTAFSLMDETSIRSTMKGRADLTVDLVAADGGNRSFGTRI